MRERVTTSDSTPAMTPAIITAIMVPPARPVIMARLRHDR